MKESDKILLAKAMGAKQVNGVWHWRGSTWDELLFEPFENANDAYAVHKFFMVSDKHEDYKDALFSLVVRPGHIYSRAQDLTPWHWTKAALIALKSTTQSSTQ